MIGKILIPQGTETEVIMINGMEVGALHPSLYCYINGSIVYTEWDFVLDNTWNVQRSIRNGTETRFDNEKYVEKRTGKIMIGMYLNGNFLVKI